MKICNICDKPLPESSGNQKYCDNCKPGTIKTQRRQAYMREKALKAIREPKHTRMPDYTLLGMTLGEVSAAAKARGITYGQYVSAVSASRR